MFPSGKSRNPTEWGKEDFRTLHLFPLKNKQTKDELVDGGSDSFLVKSVLSFPTASELIIIEDGFQYLPS